MFVYVCVRSVHLLSRLRDREAAAAWSVCVVGLIISEPHKLKSLSQSSLHFVYCSIHLQAGVGLILSH